MNYYLPPGALKQELPGQYAPPPELKASFWLVPAASIMLADMDEALFIYWAPWSGPFSIVWKILITRLVEHNYMRPIFLYDSAEWTVPRVAEVFASAGGWCETAWIKNGSVFARDDLFHYLAEHGQEQLIVLIDSRLQQLMN